MVGILNKKEVHDLKLKKKQVIKSLEWAISNNDKGLATVCDIELKAILKELKRLSK